MHKPATKVSLGVVDCFTTCDDAASYEEVKSAALKAGRFSVFDATETEQTAIWFGQLCGDPDIVLVDMSYPWTGVRLKQKPEMFTGDKQPPQGNQT